MRATFFSLSRELFDLHLIPGTFRSAGGGRSRKKDGQARGYRHRNESSASSHSDEDMERSDDESSVGGGGGHRRDRPRRDSQSSRVSVQVRENPRRAFLAAAKPSLEKTHTSICQDRLGTNVSAGTREPDETAGLPCSLRPRCPRTRTTTSTTRWCCADRCAKRLL